MFGRPLALLDATSFGLPDTTIRPPSSPAPNVDDPVADRGDRHVRLLQPNAPVATLPEPVHSADVTIIAESILRTAKTEKRDAAVLERIALVRLRLAQPR
jgi:hypothetical protein